MSDVKISVGIDDSEVKKKLNDINKEITNANKLYRELGKSNSFAEQLEVAGRKAELLTQKMKIQRQTIDKLEDEMLKYCNQLKKTEEGSEEFKKLTTQIEEVQSKLKKYRQEFEMANAQFKTTKKQITDLGGSVDHLGDEFEEAESDVKGFNKIIGKAGDYVKTAKTDFDQLKTTLKNINFASIGQSIQNAGQIAFNFGSNMVRGFVDALDVSKEFTSELETQQFLFDQLPKGVQEAIGELSKLSLEYGFTDLQGDKMLTDLASFLERNGLTGKIDLGELFMRSMDLSAMYDLPIEEVVEHIERIMLGNFENSDALGFNMNVASVEEFLNVDWEKLDYAERMVASLNYTMLQTEMASGRAKEEAEGFASQWNLAKENLGEVKNMILSYVQDVILPYIQKLNECIKPLKEWIETHKELTAKIAIGVGIFSALAVALGAILIPIGSIIALMPVFSAVFSGIGTALSAIMSPIGLVVVAIGALVAGLVYAYNHSEKFRNAVNTAWESIKATVQTVVDFIRPYIEKFLAWLPGAWDTATGFLSDVWIGLVEGIVDACGKVKDFIISFWNKYGSQISDTFSHMWSFLVKTFEDLKTGIMKIFNGLKDFWDKWGGTITAFFSLLWENIKLKFETAWNGIKAIVNIGIELVVGLLQTFARILDGDFSGAWDSFKNTIVNVWNIIKEQISLALSNIWESIKNTFNHVKEFAPTIWDGIKSLFIKKSGEIGDSVGTFFGQIITGAITSLSQLVTIIGEWLSKVITSVLEWGQGMAINMGEALIGVYNTAKTWFNDTIVGGFKEWIGNLVNSFVEMKNNIIAKFQQLVEEAKIWFDQLPYNIGFAIGTVIRLITEWCSEMSLKAMEIGKNFIDKIVEFFTTLPVKIGTFIGEVLAKVNEWATNMITKANETGTNFVNNIVTFIKELPTKIKTFLTNIIDNVKTWTTDMIKKANETGTKFVNSVIDFVKTLPSKVKSHLTTTINNVATWVTNMITKAKDVGTRFVSSIIEFFKTLPTKIGTFLTNTISKVTTWVTQMIQKAKDAGTKFVNGVIDFVKTLPTKFKAKIDEVITKVKTFITDLKTKAQEAGKGFGDKLVEWLGKIPSRVIAVGKRIVQSLWNGISNMGGWLSSKFSGFVDGLVAGITGGKDSFDIKLTSNYETSAITGKPLTVFDYGKDVKSISLPNPFSDFDYGKDVRTISLADFDNPYLYGKSTESQLFTNAFSTASTYNYVNSQSITNNRSTVKKLGEEEKDKEINITINIDQMNGTEQDVQKLVKQIENYLKPRSKRW